MGYKSPLSILNIDYGARSLVHLLNNYELNVLFSLTVLAILNSVAIQME